jgi:hypothetical protein
LAISVANPLRLLLDLGLFLLGVLAGSIALDRVLQFATWG